MNFETSQGIEILGLLKSGLGRKMACRKVGIGYRRFLNHLRDDDDFANRVRLVEAARNESCETVLYRYVVEAQDPRFQLHAAIAYLGRRDRAKAARRGRKDAAAARREAARSGD